MVFLDKCCIPQKDPIVKAYGISRLADNLHASDKLLILWSPDYLDRLWCVYELAVFLRTHDLDDVILVNMDHFKLCATLMILQFFSILALGLTEDYDPRSKLYVGYVLVIATSLLIGRGAFGCSQEWQKFCSRVKRFSVHKAKCSSSADYTNLKQLINDMYGSETKFETVVRGLWLERLKTTVYQQGRSTVFEETRRAVLVDTVANGGFNPGRCLAVLQDQGLLSQYRRRLAFEIDDHQFRAQRDASLEQRGYKAEKDALSAAHRRLSEIVLSNLRQHLSKVTRGQPFVRAREARTMNSTIDGRIEMGPIISMEDIYIALVSARGNPGEDAAFSDMSISLKTPPLSELRERYISLNGKDNIDAADIDATDRLSYAWEAHQTRTLQRESEAGALIASGADPAKIRRYLRGGAPSQSRLELWALALDSAVQPGELEDLHDGVIAQEWITDDIIRDDVAERTADGNYFPFEDLIESLSLTLSRDLWVGTNARAAPHQSMSPDDEETSEAVPPSSHVPFEGWACLACPFAYLAESINPTLYGVYRAFYCRYWVRLVSIEADIDSLPYLAGLCENLVYDQLILMCPVHDGFGNHTNNGHDSGGLVPPISREYFHNNSGNTVGAARLCSNYFRVLPVNPSEGPKGVQEVVKKLVDMKIASLRHEIPTNSEEFTTGHSAETMDQVRLIPVGIARDVPQGISAHATTWFI
ncbi:hypothetical protein FOZ61_006139 [Perkinsus olseni]|uniref:TIR domain-containing protein n=1 Tax=Perkinsus olseni TaxID=32597 RepID=A0A7J6LEI1_PEROL|nr:hypothetical protein FOZ61_006139 [Perkinsus olseni]